MADDIAVEQLLLDDEFGYSIVAEPLSRNIDSILSDLQTARGAAYRGLCRRDVSDRRKAAGLCDAGLFCRSGNG